MINKVKELREITGAPIVSCKTALEQSQWEVKQAVLWLRKNGQAEKRANKVAKEGTIGYYLHTGSKICAMVEVNCETDFVARSKDFTDFAHELAIHIAAANPLWTSRDEVPDEVVASEKEVFRAKITNKPDNIVEKIIAGKLEKFYKDTCLMEQVFVKDTSITIQDKFNDLNNKLKEKLVVKRFARFEVGVENG